MTLFALAVALIPASGRAVEIYHHFPEAIHPDERYVVYSHGLIAEGDDPKPISPKYGQYDFPGIKQPSRITLIGFSRGGQLTAVISSRLSKSFKEVAISTGRKHGAFFQPLPEWVQPLKAWIAETNR